MKNSILLLTLLVVSISYAQAQPNWTIDPSAFNNVMNVSAILTGPCNTNDDILAVFDDNDQLRGVSQTDNGDNEFFMTVRSNVTSNELLHYKYYDSESDSIFNLTDQTFTFLKNSFLGTPNPVEVSSPESVPPIALCNNFDVFLNTSGEASISIDDVDAGSSDNCGVFTRSISTSSFDCTTRGLQAVTLTIIDASQNANTCVANVTVLDTIKPIVVCKSIEVFLNAAGSAGISALDINDNSTDNCTLSSLTISKSQFNCTNLGVNMVTLAGVDNSTNVDSCIATVLVRDTIKPIILCKNATLYLDNSGSVMLAISDVDNGSTDNCSIVSRTLSKEQFSCIDLGAQTVELTIEDNSGNISKCETTITILDTITPTPSCLSPSIYINENGIASLSISETDNGSIDNCNTLIKEISQSSFTCIEKGNQNITMTVRDASGNIDSCISTVMVLDTIKPVIVCKNIEIYLDAVGSAEIKTSDVDDNSTDNCTLSTLTTNTSQFDCTNLGANMVTVTGVDNSANVNDCIAIVLVRDTIKPIMLCKNATLYLDNAGAAMLSISDVDNGSTDNCSIVSRTLSKQQFSCTDLGSQIVELTIEDNSGNMSICEATITVLDTIAPSPSCLTPTIYIKDNGVALLSINEVDNGISDNCNMLIKELSQSSFYCVEKGSHNVSLTVSDGSGNFSICTSTVTILDTIKPIVICKNIEVFLDAAGNVPVTTSDVDNNSTDNCTLMSLGIDVTKFDCTKLGPNMVTLTGVDNSSNASSCVANVTVSDTISPIAKCKNVEIILDFNGQATITASDINNGSTDNCSIQSISLSKTDFSCGDIGTQSVTMTVTDQSNNITTCSAVVTVVDNIGPTASCKNINVELSQGGTATIIAADIDNGSNDNCSIANLEISKSTFEKNETRVQTVTLTVTDIVGLQSTCAAQITIINNYENDVINCSDGLDNDNDGLTDCADPDCGKPLLQGVEVTQPTSHSCALSNSDGIITLSQSFGDQFSIDQGVSFQSTPTFDKLRDGTYELLMLNSETSCKTTTSGKLDNSVVMKAAAVDVILACTDDLGILLEVDVTDNSSSYSTIWTDNTGNTVQPSARVEEGVYKVLVEDGNGCKDTSSMQVTRAPYTDDLISDEFIMGAATLCPGTKGVTYETNISKVQGSIKWSYTGVGATITDEKPMNMTMNLDVPAEVIMITAEFSGKCGTKTSEKEIQMGTAQICALYSDCVGSLYILPIFLEDLKAPSVMHSDSILSAAGIVKDKQLVFRAAESIELRAGFEVDAHGMLVAEIMPCD